MYLKKSFSTSSTVIFLHFIFYFFKFLKSVLLYNFIPTDISVVIYNIIAVAVFVDLLV